MRKVTFGGAPSLDGYFARKDDAVDWLMWSKEAATIMSDYWKTIDTIVMGRKTYEAALKMDKGKDNLYSGMKTYVFSRTLKPHKQANVEVFCGDAVQFMKRLKKADGKDSHGFSLMYTDFLDAQSVKIRVHPWPFVAYL